MQRYIKLKEIKQFVENWRHAVCDMIWQTTQHKTLHQMLEALLEGGFWKVIWRLIVQSSVISVFRYRLKVAVLITYFVSVWKQKVASPIQPICLEMKMPFHFQTSSPRPKSALWVVPQQIMITLFEAATVSLPIYFFLFYSEKMTSALAESRHFKKAWSRQKTFHSTVCCFLSLTKWRMVA